MKILNLTAENRAELTTHRAAIKAEMDALLKGHKKLAKALAQRDRLQGEVAELESKLDPDDVKGATELSTKQTQLAAAERVVHHEQQHAPVIDTLTPVIRAAQPTIWRTLKPNFEAHLEKLTAILRPHCTSDAVAKGLAFQTQEAGSIMQKCHTHFVLPNMTVTNAIQALALIDEIMTGELIWSFDPMMDGKAAA